MPATRFQRRLGTAQSNCTQGYVAHFSKKPLQTAARQMECSYFNRKRVGIDRGGQKILSRFCWSFIPPRYVVLES